MYIFLNKQKKILAIQNLYRIDGEEIKEGMKTSTNVEEYKVKFTLPNNDYIQSIVGYFGASDFL